MGEDSATVKPDWTKFAVNVAAVRFLAERVLKKRPHDLTAIDFRKNGLRQLLAYFGGKVYTAISLSYPYLNIQPHEVGQVPNGFFSKKENRVATIKSIVCKEERLQGDPRGLTYGDLKSHGIASLLSYVSGPHGKLYAAISEAYPELGIMPWELVKVKGNFFSYPENRISAVRWLVGKIDRLGGDPRNLSHSDFVKYRITNLLGYHSGVVGPIYSAVIEAYPELNILPWEMSNIPLRLFSYPENRIAAVRWLVGKTERLQGDPKGLTIDDFLTNGVVEVLRHFRGTGIGVHSAISEAYPELGIMPWELQLPNNFFDSQGNRIAAVRWLVSRLDRLQGDPRNLTFKDFYENKLANVIDHAHGPSGSFHAAISEAYPELGIMPWELSQVAKGFFSIPENRVAAVRWLVSRLDRLQGDPRGLTQLDFGSNRLKTLLNYVPAGTGSVHGAVAEAFPELDIRPWEMPQVTNGFFSDPSNRIAAIAWLAEKLGKDVGRLSTMDFRLNRLSNLLNRHYGGSVQRAIAEALLVSDATAALRD